MRLYCGGTESTPDPLGVFPIGGLLLEADGTAADFELVFSTMLTASPVQERNQPSFNYPHTKFHHPSFDTFFQLSQEQTNKQTEGLTGRGQTYR